MKIAGFHVKTAEFQNERPLGRNGNPVSICHLYGLLDSCLFTWALWEPRSICLEIYLPNNGTWTLIGLSRKRMSSVMPEKKLCGKSWLKICSSRWDCSLTPHPRIRSGSWAAVSAVQLGSDCSPTPPRIRSGSWAAVSAVQLCSDCSLTPPPQNQKWKLGCSECSSTLQWLQSGPPPPPPIRKLDWICKEKTFIFFTQKINWKKNFVAGKVRLLAPKPTHLVNIYLPNDKNELRSMWTYFVLNPICQWLPSTHFSLFDVLSPMWDG